MPLEAPYGGKFSPHNSYLAVMYMREWATELMLRSPDLFPACTRLHYPGTEMNLFLTCE